MDERDGGERRRGARVTLTCWTMALFAGAAEELRAAWIAVGFPASGLALTRGLAGLATGLITPGDCWATSSSVALNTTDATTTAVEKRFDIGPREFGEGTIAL